MKHLLLSLLLLATGCSIFQSPIGRQETEQHASDLLMCQERGRAAGAECKSVPNQTKNCDTLAIAQYESCKKEKNL